jgi:hypothetical protein
MLKFRCTTCDQKIGVPDEWENHLVRCPRCKSEIPVPKVVEVEVKRVPIFAEPPKPGGPSRPTVKKSDPPRQQRSAATAKPQAAKDQSRAPSFASAEPVITKARVPTDGAVFAKPNVKEPVAKDNTPALTDQRSSPAPKSPPVEKTPADAKAQGDGSPRSMAESLHWAVQPGITSSKAVADLLKSLGSESTEAPKKVETAPADVKVIKPRPPAKRGPVNYQARTLGAIGLLAGAGGLALNALPAWTKFSVPLAIAGAMAAVLATVGRAPRRVLETAVAGAALVVCASAAMLALLAGSGVLPGVNAVAMAHNSRAILAQRKGDVEVRVKSVSIVRPVVYASGQWKTRDKPERFLQVELELRELQPAGRVAYRSWGRSQDGVDPPALTDNEGNPLKLQDLSPLVPVGRPREWPAYLDGVRQGVSDVLEFEVPPAAAQMLDLQLPAANFGGDGVVEFHIPSAMLRK